MEILLTGASTGIGRACALAMAKAGHNVWGGVRNAKSFKELTTLHAKGLTPLLLDVTDSESIAKALRHIRKNSGTLDALVNNAGLAIGGPIEGVSLDDWRRQFDVNFFGVVELTKNCLPLLREAKGRVVNVSSLSGRVASPYLAPYAASKFALEAFSDSLRREMRPHNVKVVVVEPGPIRTPIWEKSIKEATKRANSFDLEIQKIYGVSMNKFMKSMEKSGDEGASVLLVVEAVRRALTAVNPRTRYPVGPGIGLLTTLSGVLPDPWLDSLIRARAP